MDEEYEDSGGIRWRVIILILLVVLVSTAIVLAYFLLHKRDDENIKPLGYAKNGVVETGITVVDEHSMPDAAGPLFFNDPASEISLEYKNNPQSADGKNFTCHIANAAENVYDMYIAVYADRDCSDELFRSERLSPGTSLEELTLARELEPGVHELTTAFIQVEDESETVRAQTLISMDFTVS